MEEKDGRPNDGAGVNNEGTVFAGGETVAAVSCVLFLEHRAHEMTPQRMGDD